MRAELHEDGVGAENSGTLGDVQVVLDETIGAPDEPVTRSTCNK